MNRYTLGAGLIASAQNGVPNNLLLFADRVDKR